MKRWAPSHIRPEMTPGNWALLVKENGKEAYNGLKMLLYQGVEAFELWNDVAVSKETADRIYQRMEQELSGK